ncbi:MAG: ZIP family zinc transporter [Dehalococcoidia bacterium]
MPPWMMAGVWGLVAGSALLVGAALGYSRDLPQRLIAAVMALGAGVLIAALAFDLMEDAFERGGLDSTALGFIVGAALFTGINWLLARNGAKHRKRSGHHQKKEAEQEGSGLALAIGALLDGIPESMVIGVSLIGGGAVSLTAVVAVFLSNIPEGLSSSSGMRKAKRSAMYVFGLWTGIAVFSGVSAIFGFAVLHQFGDEVIALTTAVAAGAVLAMVADTMIPEAFASTHDFTGLITVIGFLVAFALTKLG